MKKIICDLCGESVECKDNKFLCLELFEDEFYREGHNKSLDAFDICKDCKKKLKTKYPFKKFAKRSKNE